MVEFIYNSKNSRYSTLECYDIYDTNDLELVYDLKYNRSYIGIDRKNKTIYFMSMDAEDHWILEKQYYFKIIKEFLANASVYDCEGYTVNADCTGGKIYYKYN